MSAELQNIESPVSAPAVETPEQKAARLQRIIESEPKKSLFTRQWLLSTVLFLYVVVGIPLWFKFTEIYRAPLPSNFINALAQNHNVDIKITNDVYLRVGDGFNYPDLAEATQIQLNHDIQEQQNDPSRALAVQWNATVSQEPDIPEDAYVLDLDLGKGEGIAMDEVNKRASLFYRLESIKNNDVPFFVTQTILYHIFKTELDLLRVNRERGIKAIRYSPNVHLSFKLLTGDGYPVDWEIDQALTNYFTPLVEEFKSFINFTVDTEIKYFTELNLPSNEHKINSNDLSTILDFSEWDISSNEFSYPTLNFVLYFPSTKQAPLEFTEDSEAPRNAFLIPQWGSVIIHKDSLGSYAILDESYIHPLLETFTSELFTLLGIPKDPKTPRIRIDATKKFTIIDNLNRAVDSLQSLLKLSESLPNISIPKTVLNNVKKALDARQRCVDKLNHDKDFNGALLDSIDMLNHAERAFFDPEMVQQTFFPQEHKVAVYMPLIGPLSLILLLGSLRVANEYKLYKKKRD